MKNNEIVLNDLYKNWYMHALQIVLEIERWESIWYNGVCGKTFV